MPETQYRNHSPTLPVYHYRFEFSAPAPLQLPAYAGSAWRGAFGHALKKTVCVVRNTPCNQCMLKSSCAYSYIFETPPPANVSKMRKYNASPHPFVLQFPKSTDPTGNGLYAINMQVFGHGQRFFPYIVHAMQRAGRDGIGGQRQVLELQLIQQILPDGQQATIFQSGQLNPVSPAETPKLPAMPNHIEIKIHTPIRIKQQGHNLNQQTFNFGGFFGNLLRRISMLSYFHTDTPLETDFAALSQQARTVNFDHQDIRWYDWTRYSSRQQTEMNMGGIIGSLSLDMQQKEIFWPYLWLGQWTHVGKATSMGLGHYSIQTASLPVQH